MIAPRKNLRDHLVDDVLAWWAANGVDREHHGVLACWDNRGTRLGSDDKYTWTQGRWAWTTATVARLGAEGAVDVDPARYAQLARTTSEFVRDHCLLPDGTTAFLTTRTGTPKEQSPGSGLHTSVFADLFAALGFAGTALVDDETDWGGLAVALLESGYERIRAGTARSEPYPVPAGHRSLALPMILIGAGEQVVRATGSDQALRIVRWAVSEVVNHHLRGTDVIEMPAADGSHASLLTRHRTPGHVLELVWFLEHARDIAPDVPSVDALVDVALHALAIGWDEEYGGVLRYVDRDGGRPLGEGSDDGYEALVRETWDTKLWWPNAEAVYALRLLEARSRSPQITRWRERLEPWVLGTFPEGDGREWTQIRQRDTTPVEKVVALPLKDPMHVARALLLSVALEHREGRSTR